MTIIQFQNARNVLNAIVAIAHSLSVSGLKSFGKIKSKFEK